MGLGQRRIELQGPQCRSTRDRHVVDGRFVIDTQKKMGLSEVRPRTIEVRIQYGGLLEVSDSFAESPWRIGPGQGLPAKVLLIRCRTIRMGPKRRLSIELAGIERKRLQGVVQNICLNAA